MMKGIINLCEYGLTLNLYGSDGKLTDVFALQDCLINTFYGVVSLQELIEVYEFIRNLIQGKEVKV